VTIVIPTFGREQVLVTTIRLLLKQAPDEIIIVDQTAQHEKSTEEALEAWRSEGLIQHIKQAEPSIPAAMNEGVLQSSTDLILFLDDDIVPGSGLLKAHNAAHSQHTEAWAVVGQILQPGERPVPMKDSERFRFNSTAKGWIDRAMAGNLSVKKTRFLEAGGFDENFAGAAYMFETEFAERLIDQGGKVLFYPLASIDHLQAKRGGTRGHGHHLTTSQPSHSAGAHYYYSLRHNAAKARLLSLCRAARSVRTRYHLTHPWHILTTLTAEARGFQMAVDLHRAGQKLIQLHHH